MRALHSALFFYGLFMLAPIAAAQHAAADSHSQRMAATDLEKIHGFMRTT